MARRDVKTAKGKTRQTAKRGNKARLNIICFTPETLAELLRHTRADVLREQLHRSIDAMSDDALLQLR